LEIGISVIWIYLKFGFLVIGFFLVRGLGFGWNPGAGGIVAGADARHEDVGQLVVERYEELGVDRRKTGFGFKV
jgi:hypothetical protein